jgi:hypothetical protein
LVEAVEQPSTAKSSPGEESTGTDGKSPVHLKYERRVKATVKRPSDSHMCSSYTLVEAAVSQHGRGSPKKVIALHYGAFTAPFETTKGACATAKDRA